MKKPTYLGAYTLAVGFTVVYLAWMAVATLAEQMYRGW